MKEDYIQESGAAKKVGDTKYPRAACHAKMQNAADKSKTNPILHRNNTIGVKNFANKPVGNFI